MRLLVSLIAGFAMLGSAALADTCRLVGSDQVPFEVRKGGDDGLTNHLATEIESAFTADCPQHFVLSKGGGYSALVITIDQNVTWSQVGKRTRAFYSVTFLAQGDRRSHAKGSCWQHELARCAAQIRKAAPSVSMA